MWIESSDGTLVNLDAADTITIKGKDGGQYDKRRLVACLSNDAEVTLYVGSSANCDELLSRIVCAMKNANQLLTSLAGVIPHSPQGRETSAAPDGEDVIGNLFADRVPTADSDYGATVDLGRPPVYPPAIDPDADQETGREHVEPF